jgi:four helix bundle protein
MESMGTVERFEDIAAWQTARILVKSTYSMTKQDAFARDFGLRDQMQRAAVSVMSNFAEGFERGSSRKFRQFLYIAKASAAEVRSLLYVAYDLEYIDNTTYEAMSEQAIKVSCQIASFIRYLNSRI